MTSIKQPICVSGLVFIVRNIFNGVFSVMFTVYAQQLIILKSDDI